MTGFGQQMRWVNSNSLIYVGEQTWSTVQNSLDRWDSEANMSSVLNRQYNIQSINTKYYYSTTVKGP